MLRVHERSQDSLQKWTLPCGADSSGAVISPCDFPLSREQFPPAKNEAMDWQMTLGGSDIPTKIMQSPSLSSQLHGAPLLAPFPTLDLASFWF